VVEKAPNRHIRNSLWRIEWSEHHLVNTFKNERYPSSLSCEDGTEISAVTVAVWRNRLPGERRSLVAFFEAPSDSPQGINVVGCVVCGEPTNTSATIPAGNPPIQSNYIIVYIFRIEKQKQERKQRERDRRSHEVEARKQLGNLRVVQRNLVYVTNVPANIAKEEVTRCSHVVVVGTIFTLRE